MEFVLGFIHPRILIYLLEEFNEYFALPVDVIK